MRFETFKELINYFANKFGKDINGELLYYEVSEHIGVMAVRDEDSLILDSYLVYTGLENDNQWTLLLSQESLMSAQAYVLFMESVYEAVSVEFDKEESIKTTNLGIDLDI